MADHAACEHRHHVDHHLKGDRNGADPLVPECRHPETRDDGEGEEQPSRVPALAREADDEREQVERQRQYPQQRERGDLETDHVGPTQQHHRRGGRKQQPKVSRRPVTGGRLAAGGPRARATPRGALAACPAAVGVVYGPGVGSLGPRSDLQHRPAAQTSGQHEHDQPHRPRPTLSVKEEVGLDQEGVGHQREQRASVGEGVQSIDVPVRFQGRDPSLQQRAGRRQRKERQPGSCEQQEQNV